MMHFSILLSKVKRRWCSTSLTNMTYRMETMVMPHPILLERTSIFSRLFSMKLFVLECL